MCDLISQYETSFHIENCGETIGQDHWNLSHHFCQPTVAPLGRWLITRFLRKRYCCAADRGSYGRHLIQGEAERRSGNADSGDWTSAVVQDRSADAPHALFVFFVIDRVASVSNEFQISFEFSGRRNGFRRQTLQTMLTED